MGVLNLGPKILSNIIVMTFNLDGKLHGILHSRTTAHLPRFVCVSSVHIFTYMRHIPGGALRAAPAMRISYLPVMPAPAPKTAPSPTSLPSLPTRRPNLKSQKFTGRAQSLKHVFS